MRFFLPQLGQTVIVGASMIPVSQVLASSHKGWLKAAHMLRFCSDQRAFLKLLESAQRPGASSKSPHHRSPLMTLGGALMKRPILSTVLAALLGGAIAAVAALALANGGQRVSEPAPRSTASQARSTASEAGAGARSDIATSTLTAAQVYARDSSGIVAIKAESSGSEDSGTGIVLNEEGLILTNDHVIAGASRITVSPGKRTGRSKVASVVGEEANSDIALVKIDPSGLGLKPLKLTSSSSLKIGEAVYAIGNPYNLDETLTQGIVSALNRTIDAPNGTKIEGAIQTDAALNPGNSGGPLINGEGNVIGINSQIASYAASVPGSQPGNTGVGFAISTNTAERAMRRIEAGETVAGRSEAAIIAEREGREGYGSAYPYRQSSPYGQGSGEGGAGGGAAGGSEPERRTEREAGPETLIVP